MFEPCHFFTCLLRMKQCRPQQVRGDLSNLSVSQTGASISLFCWFLFFKNQEEEGPLFPCIGCLFCDEKPEQMNRSMFAAPPSTLSQHGAMKAKENSYLKSIWWKSQLKIMFPPSLGTVRALRPHVWDGRDGACQSAPRVGVWQIGPELLLLVLKTLRCRRCPCIRLFLLICCNELVFRIWSLTLLLSLI